MATEGILVAIGDILAPRGILVAAGFYGGC